MLSPGTRPDLSFSVKSVFDGKVGEAPFSKLLKGPTLVSVYMRNNTGACDLQTASLAAAAAELKRAGWSVVAVSRDTCASHIKYAAKLGIDFTLVSDPEFKTAAAFDSLVEKSMYGKKYVGPERAAYLLSGDGELLAVIPKVEAASHGEQALAAAASLARA